MGAFHIRGQTVGVSAIDTGLLVGNGNNKTYTSTTVFSLGDEVIIHSTVLDGNGNPVAGATVNIDIAGANTTSIIRETSDANGIAFASWSTSKNGKNATATGAYTATVTNVTVSGFNWNVTATSTDFTLQ